MAIVTRDAVGHGAATAEALAADGVTVVMADAVDDPETTVEAVLAAHGALHVLHLSVAHQAEGWCDAAATAIGGSGGGAIVAMVTTRALAGDLVGSDEAAAGGAVVALTRAIATAHGKRGVRANCIAVPPADLDETLLAQSMLVPRPPAPDDIAATAAFLASDDASFITGQVIRCDGGLLAHLPHYASLRAAGTTTVGGGR